MVVEVCCPVTYPRGTCGNLIFNEIKLKFNSSLILATFQVLSRHVWLVATILDRVDLEHCCHCREFPWAALV